MNWRTNLDEVLLAMAKLEGDAWLLRQLDMLDGTENRSCVSVAEIIRCLNRESMEYWPDASFEVYGDGGFNRYYFGYDGSVVFSLSHAISYRDRMRALELFDCR